MMAVHEVRLPDDIERGAVGGPQFKTLVHESDTGFEQRDIKWSQARGSWDISYGIMAIDDPDSLKTVVSDINAFFRAREGRAHSFRFKDWSDFEIGDPSDPSNDNQPIGVGDDSTVNFQIFKRYTSGGINYDRTLYKIVQGTLSVFIDAVLQVEGGGNDYTVDYDTGIITFNLAPTAGQTISIACEFDVLVRFNTDKLNISVETFNAGSIPGIEIIELRLET